MSRLHMLSVGVLLSLSCMDGARKRPVDAGLEPPPTGGAGAGTGGAKPSGLGGTGGSMKDAAADTGGAGGESTGGASGMGGADAAVADARPDARPDAPRDTARLDAPPPSPPPAAVAPVPTADQIAWHRLGLTAFFHFGMNTFTNDEVGDGNASPDTFNPSGLDTKQWVDALVGAGFKQGTLVAKHHDGFCLWQTKCSQYGVAESSWKGGKGDVVKEFTDAAHAAKFRVGLYLSPLDNHAADSSSSPDYGAKFRCWVDELLTNYGRVDEIWFDGNGAPSSVNAALYAHIKQLQPHVVIFTGPEIAAAGADLRWVGNEGGYAPQGESSVQQLGGKTIWYPSESDTSIRPGWFYHPDQDGSVKSLAQLTKVFFETVGRNSVLILNVPPDKVGVLPAPDVARLGQLGASLRNLFTTNVAAGKSATAESSHHDRDYGPQKALDGNLDTFWAAAAGQTSGRLEVDLGGAFTVRIVDLAEPIALGERSRKYHVEIQKPGETTWTTVGTGTAIGQRNLLRLEPAQMAEKVAVVIEEARGAPALAELGVY